MESFEIRADALITSLVAISPHASTSKDDEIRHRVRFDVGLNELTLSALSGRTIGVLRVRLLDPIDDIFAFDLPPEETAHICRLFKPGKDLPEIVRVELDRDAKSVEFSEAGGLISREDLPALRAYSVPELGKRDIFPDLGRVVAGFLTSPATPRSVTEIPGAALQAMATTAAALDERIVLEATTDRGPLVARVGETFIGLVSAVRDEGDEEHGRRLERTREEWLLRLPDPSTAPPQQRSSDESTVQYAIPFTAAAAVQEVTPGMVAAAAEQVIATQLASTSLIQRKLRVGFSAAIRIMDQLEEFGVVSEPDEDGRREVQVEPADIDKVKLEIMVGV